MYFNNDFTNEEFERSYRQIYQSIDRAKFMKEDKCSLILGGQPGSGKSNLYNTRNFSSQYFFINGDEYRQYHPHVDDIEKYDLDNYAERTQLFSNKVVERLIQDLSQEGINILVEGTLRDPNVPINTCKHLNNHGYKVDLLVVACDAEEAWQSTLNRAITLKKMGERPRLVPIDKYNQIVTSLPSNLEIIKNEECFNNITIVDRADKIIYDKDNRESISVVIGKHLNLNKWNKNLQIHINEYQDAKIATINRSRNINDFSRSH